MLQAIIKSLVKTLSILLKSLKYPLAAPSANISEGISPVTKDDVYDEFGEKIKFILEGGRSKVGVESTIISLVKKPQVLRLGGLDISTLNKILKTNLKYLFLLIKYQENIRC